MEMAKTKLILFACLCLGLCSCAQVYRWQCVSIDGGMTGCSAANVDNVPEALGMMQSDGSYKSPSGNIYSQETATAKVASVVLAAQPEMSKVKKVIAHSDEMMVNNGRESRLSNWFVEIVMDKVASLSGRKVDVGIGNFGGIRAGMPEGDVTLDDIKSMFPFKNYIVYLELPGSVLKEVFSSMAAGKFQAVCGPKITVADHKLVSVEIDGSPIDDDKLYSVATISFLLHGGDGLTLADGAVNVQEYDVAISEAVLEHIHALTAEGKSIKGSDARYVVIK